MKYYIQSEHNGNVIVTADNLQEAQDLAAAYEDNHFDDAIVVDEAGNLVNDWFDFIYDFVSDSDLQKIDIHGAENLLAKWIKEETLPAGLTAENLLYIFNNAVEAFRQFQEECIRENDEAEFQTEIREAAAYGDDPVPVPNYYPAHQPKKISIDNGATFWEINTVDDAEELFAEIEYRTGYSLGSIWCSITSLMDRDLCDYLNQMVMDPENWTEAIYLIEYLKRAESDLIIG